MFDSQIMGLSQIANNYCLILPRLYLTVTRTKVGHGKLGQQIPAACLWITLTKLGFVPLMTCKLSGNAEEWTGLCLLITTVVATHPVSHSLSNHGRSHQWQTRSTTRLPLGRQPKLVFYAACIRLWDLLTLTAQTAPRSCGFAFIRMDF